MSNLLRLYLRALDKRPLITQAVSTGSLMAVGDAVAQLGVERKKLQQYELERTGRFFLFGTCVVGPVLRGWYGVLDKIFRTGTPTSLALKKMALDQTAFAPTFIVIFLGSMSYWKSGSLEFAQQKVKQDFVDVVLTNWKLWPAAQIINFYFIPLQHRVIYVQFIALIWNTYLAYKTEQPQKDSH